MALSTNKEGNVVTKLASATELPRMVKVRQKLDHSHIEPEEIPALVQRELEPMRSRIRAGMRVAITCGSRGVANIAIITRAIVDFVKSCGGEPFVFPAQTLTVELYLEAGIRGCEIGYILADRDPVTRENRFGGLDLLRLAIPRRVYTNNHMDVIAVALKNVFDRREQITRGFQITWEAPLMRHFTVQLERAK